MGSSTTSVPQVISNIIDKGGGFVLKDGQIMYKIPKSINSSDFFEVVKLYKEDVKNYILRSGLFYIYKEYLNVNEYRGRRVAMVGNATKFMIDNMENGNLGKIYSHATSSLLRVNAIYNETKAIQAANEVMSNFDVLSSKLKFRNGNYFFVKSNKWRSCITVFDEKNKNYMDQICNIARRPFDLGGFQVRIFIAPESNGFLFGVVVNHVLCDAESMEIIKGCFISNYFSEDIFKFNSIQYLEYLKSNRKSEISEFGKSQKEYWGVVLSGIEGTRIPVKKDIATEASRYVTVISEIDDKRSGRIQDAARRYKVPLVVVFLAALFLSYYEVLDNSDALIGTVDSTRNLAGLERAVGPFLQVLPVRVQRPRGGGMNTFIEMISNVYMASKSAISLFQENTYERDCDELFIKKFPLLNFSYKHSIRGRGKYNNLFEYIPFPLLEENDHRARPQFQFSQDIRINFSPNGTEVIISSLKAYYDEAELDDFMKKFGDHLTAIIGGT